MTRAGQLPVERVSCRTCARPIDYDRAAFGPGGLCPIVCRIARHEPAPEVDQGGRCAAHQSTNPHEAEQPALI